MIAQGITSRVYIAGDFLFICETGNISGVISFYYPNQIELKEALWSAMLCSYSLSHYQVNRTYSVSVLWAEAEVLHVKVFSARNWLGYGFFLCVNVSREKILRMVNTSTIGELHSQTFTNYRYMLRICSRPFKRYKDDLSVVPLQECDHRASRRWWSLANDVSKF